MFDVSTVITSYIVKHLKEFGWNETRQDFKILAEGIDNFLKETMEIFSRKVSVNKSTTLSAKSLVQVFYIREEQRYTGSTRAIVKQYQKLLDAFAKADAIEYLEYLPQFVFVVVAEIIPVWYDLEDVSPMSVKEKLYFTDIPGDEPQKVLEIEGQTIRRNFW